MEGKAKDGARSSIWEILPAMEILLQHLETAKVEFEHSDYKHITIGINNAWKKLNKYYKLTDMSPIYVAVIILNPQLKWSFFEKHWKDHLDWIEDARIVVEELWRLHYKE